MIKAKKMSAALMFEALQVESEKEGMHPRSKHYLPYISEISTVISQLSTAQKKEHNVIRNTCVKGQMSKTVEDPFKSEVENIFLKYLHEHNKLIPKTGKKSIFEQLKKAYKDRVPINFPKRTAVERLHVELYDRYSTVSSNQLNK